MNWKSAAAGAALAAAAALPVTAATKGFDTFLSTCANTHVDYSAITATLDPKVWKTSEIQAATMEGVKIDQSVGRAATIGDISLTVFASTGSKGPFQITTCTMRVKNGKVDAFKRDAQDWVGFAPEAGDQKRAVFRFEDGASPRKPLTTPDFDAAGSGGGLVFLTVSADGADTMLDLIKIKK